MAETRAGPSSDDSGPRRLTLPTTHTGLFFGGPVASVYFHCQPPFASEAQSYPQAKALIAFEPAAGALRRFIAGTWRSERIAGRGLVFVPPGVLHEVRWDKHADFIEIFFEPEFVRDLPPQNVAALFDRDSLPNAVDDPVIWDLALAICQWCTDGTPAAATIADLGVLIGKRLFLRHGEPSPEKSRLRLTAEQRGRLDSYIQTHIGRRLSVPELARVVAMSVSHLGALCRNTTGKSPMDYVRECRLWKAHAMARTGNYRRREIARACGFYDGSHLNREFQKMFKRPSPLNPRRG